VSGSETDEDEPSVAPHGGLLRRTFMKYPFRVAAIFGLIVLPAFRLCAVRDEPPAPVLGHVSAFSLRTADGATFTRSALGASPWLLVLASATDTGTTPALLSAAADVAHRLHREHAVVPVVVLLPAETPAASMAAVARRLGVSGQPHYVVTGEESELRALLASLEPALGPAGPKLEPIARIALVDEAGAIRAGADIGSLGLAELTRTAVGAAKASRTR
jgi:hypothetical protein